MERLLILDDDKLFCEALSTTLESEGHAVLVAHTLARARELLKKQRVAVIFIDVFLPDGNGLDLLAGLALLPSPPEAIVVTAQGDPKGAEIAITAGAWDYVQKPANMPEIVHMVRRALQARERRRQVPELSRASGIVGSSAPMRTTLLQMFEAAQSEAPVLISGETGTGKELMARAVHQNSRRAKGPFVVVDCGAIAPTLLESELFGSMRGAFTGAVRSRQGLIMLADGGTLFLDEVGELALEQQKVFLRLLQERRFRPIGGREELPSDFRVVAATNRNLTEMAAGGTFRADLLFRLQGVVVEVPPVRMRGRDVARLARFALERTLSQYGQGEKTFSEDALEALTAYPWPGNVREMLHAVETAVLAARDDDLVHLQHLPLHLRANVARSRAQERALAPADKSRKSGPEPAFLPVAGDGPLTGAQGKEPAAGADKAARPGPSFAAAPVHTMPVTWKEFQHGELYECKRNYLMDLLRACGGSVPEAARVAGLSRQRLYILLREHDIVRQWQG
ncbi:sigma-54 dependent transcriptional regulator [Desulfovibrio sp. OttesenSCG-928-G11]|nr:sigma-54 dependent transcriptional regulator [Desulfovibrio sp. OttesenSCG-928-G11]